MERRVEAEPEFRELSKLERLDAFAEFMRDVETKDRARTVAARAEKRRAARKAQAAFRALLDDLRASGRVHVRMRWAEFLPIAEGRDAYEACRRAGQGSRPRELFEDVVAMLEEEMEAQRGLVRRVMRAFDISVDTDSTFEEVRAQMEAAAERDAEQRRSGRGGGRGEEGGALTWDGPRPVAEEMAGVPTLNLRVSATPLGVGGYTPAECDVASHSSWPQAPWPCPCLFAMSPDHV